MSDNTTCTSSNLEYTYVYDQAGSYVDVTPVDNPSTTTFEEFIIGAGNPNVCVIDVSAKPVTYEPYTHINSVTSCTIDMDSVMYQCNNDPYNPSIQVTLMDLSTGQLSGYAGE